MYGPAGRAYVYLVYGMYDCLNIVTEAEGRPAAILVRAVEPLEGATAMRDARAAWWQGRRARTAADAELRERTRLERLPEHDLARGPGLVAAAFSIDRSMTGLDLLDPASPLRLESPRPDVAPTVVATPRIGIAYAGEPWVEVPWRFADAGSSSVSGPRRPALA
jgi:DNA-3-methyladenine glycosylase